MLEKSKIIGEAGALLTTHAKKGAHEEFGFAVENTAAAVCKITEVQEYIQVLSLLPVCSYLKLYSAVLVESP